MRKNWSGNVIFQENEYLEPKSVGELQEMIKSRSHIHVRGSGHSFNSIADSTKSIVNLASIPQVIEIDEAKRCVKVSSSLKYGEIVETIESKGWAISNLASLPHISIGGSIATATHGSGIKNRNLASQVSAFEYIDSSGNIHHVEENHRDFNALLIGLGVAGIVTYYWLKLEPSFKVRQIIYENLSENELENSFNQIMSTAYSVSFFTKWDQTQRGNLWCKFRETESIPEKIAMATKATRKLHPIPEVDPEAATEQFGEPGLWLERLAHFKLDFTPSVGEEIQSEFFVDRKNAPSVVALLRDLAPTFNHMLWISELRTIAADKLWMSTAYERDSVGFHFTWKKSNFDMNIVKNIEDNLKKFNYRPHWGKVFNSDSDYLKSVYPKYADFISACRELDPQGKFLNDFAKRLLS